MTHYRIVTDRFCGFEVQSWRWWFPFWVQVGTINTHPSVERAEAYARKVAAASQPAPRRVVKELGVIGTENPRAPE